MGIEDRPVTPSSIDILPVLEALEKVRPNVTHAPTEPEKRPVIQEPARADFPSLTQRIRKRIQNRLFTRRRP